VKDKSLMRNEFSRAVVLAALVLCATSSALAQAGASQALSRPRIGLALGGGSARGIAHVGVLEWFEEHHIPIDFIVGTSMGGLVAGAYASGMTPAEIRELMKSADWDLMFLSDSPYRYKTFRRKQDKRDFPSQLEFGLKGGLSLPGALNPGQQVALMLDRIALPYGDLQSFDDLPTPFRAVATDLRKGEVIVLGRPPLSRAMRATMSIPGVFAPVNWDDWLLVDGGVLNNVPANVAREAGVDIVIAVDVGADAGDEKAQTASLFALLGKTIDTMMTTTTRRSLAAANLIIDPDLKGLSSTSWRLSDELADRGYKAAAAVESNLQPYAIGSEAHAAFQAARQAKRRRETAVPTRITVLPLGLPVSPQIEAEVRNALSPALNRPVEPDDIARRILEITGSDRFEYLTYEVTDRPTPTSLQIGVRQKTYGPPFLMLGLDLNNIDSTNFAVNLSGRVLHYGLVGAGSETRLNFVLGTKQQLGAEIVKPIGTTPLFVATRAYFDRRGRNIYLDDIFVAEYRERRFGAGLDIGSDFGRNAELRLGYDIADYKGRRRVGSPDLPDVDGSEEYARLDFALDTQTSPLVPTRGFRLRSTLRQYFSAPTAISTLDGVVLDSPQSFTSGEVRTSWFRRLRGGGDRLFLIGEAGSSFGDHPLVSDFSLGGPLRLGSFNNDQLRGANYLLFGGGYLRGVGRVPDVLGGNIFLGAWVEGGSVFEEWDNQDWKSDITGGAILETLLGPLFLGGSVGFQGGGRFYISLGPFFK
jgi:NTE family protein